MKRLACSLALVAAALHACGTESTSNPGDAATGEEDGGTNHEDARASFGEEAGNDGGSSDAESLGDAAFGPSCDVAKPFTTVRRLEVSSGSSEEFARLSPDELTIYFSSNRTTTLGGANIWVAKRAKRTDAFGTPVLLANVNTEDHDIAPMVSADGKKLVFASNRASNGLLRYDVYIATRASTADDFGTPLLVAGIKAPNKNANTTQPFLRSDVEELWFVSDRSTVGYDVFRAPLLVDGGFGDPKPIVDLSSSYNEYSPVLAANGKTFYGATHSGPQPYTIITHRRANTTATWGTRYDVSELETGGTDIPSWLSLDGCRLYFHSDEGDGGLGANDIYVAERAP